MSHVQQGSESVSVCPSLQPVDALDAVPLQIKFHPLAFHDTQEMQTCCY